MAQRFCAAPFTTFEIRTGGGVGCCCSIYSPVQLGNVYHEDMAAVWNSAKAQDFRASILDGSFRYCRADRCVYLMRGTLPTMDQITDPRLRAIIDGGTVVLDTPPENFTLAHDFTCNLACPSCRTQVVASGGAERDMMRRATDTVVLPALNSGQVRQLWMSTNGDPWASPEYRRILRHLADHDCGELYLVIHSNGQLFTAGRWAEFQGLERYRPHARISMDAVWPWTYHRLRRPGKWEQLATNLRFLAGLRAADKLRRFEVNMTVQVDNYQQLPAFIQLAKALGCDQATLWLIYNSGPWLAPDFAEKYVASPDHPEHKAFLEVLRHPVLGDDICDMLDVAAFRRQALATDSIAAPLMRRAGGVPAPEDFLSAADDLVGAGALSDALAMTTAGLQWHQDASLYHMLGCVLGILGAYDRSADALYTACDLGGWPAAMVEDLRGALRMAGRCDEGLALAQSFPPQSMPLPA